MLAFDDTGSGDPVVLIHGWAASRRIWHHVVPQLPGRRVIAVDMPGFGASPAAGDGFDLDAVAQAIWKGLPADGPVTLVGHSLGAAIALTAAAQQPARAAQLVLCAPAGLRPIPAVASGPAGVLGALAIDLRRVALPYASGSPLGRRLLLGASTATGDAVSEEDVVAMVTASEGATRTAAALEAVTRADLRPLLAQAPAALGVLCGAHDRVIPPSTIDLVLAARPDAVTDLVPGAGHVPMMERPAVFTAMLRQVLDRLAGTSGRAAPQP